MKRLYKRCLVPVLAAAVLLCALCLSGCTVSNPYGNVVDNDWTIDALNVKIDVAADRTATVEEEFYITFNAWGKHGMYRDFAVNSGEKYRDVLVRGATIQDGVETDYYPDYTFERSSGLLSLRIGSEYRAFGPGSRVRFTISYKLIPPKKATPDTYYMNAIGPGFSTEIRVANIELTMPVAIDSDKAFYYEGGYGENKGKLTPIYTNDNKTVSLTTALNPYEGVTVDLTMPKGTFGIYVDGAFFLTLFVGLLLVFAAVALKLTVGRSKPLVPITHYYPPEADGKPLSPVEAGVLIDNTCDNADVTSLLFYWASNGYVALNDIDGDMEIELLKPLPQSRPAYEHTMYDKLYALSTAFEDEDGERRTVTTDALREKFYPAVSAVRSGVTAQYRGKLYDGKTRLWSGLIGAAVGLFLIATVFFAYLRISLRYLNPVSLVAAVPVAAVYLLGWYIANHYYKYAPAKRKFYVVFYALVALAVTAVEAAFVANDAIGILEKCLLVVLSGTAAAIAPFINRRTDYYTDALGDVLGFKEFLTLAEKDKLEMLLEENPQYYYDILPYANVLGVSDIWADKFKDLTVEPPTYYRGDTVFTILMFNSFYRRSYHSFSTASVSRPSSSSHSGGGFSSGGSGGGFSGGGFGGGGGRSW